MKKLIIITFLIFSFINQSWGRDNIKYVYVPFPEYDEIVNIQITVSPDEEIFGVGGIAELTWDYQGNVATAKTTRTIFRKLILDAKRVGGPPYMPYVGAHIYNLKTGQFNFWMIYFDYDARFLSWY